MHTRSGRPMAAELQMTFRPAHASPMRYSWPAFAERALKATAAFWFVVAIIGQLFFAFTVASFYALTAMRGDLQAWDRFLSHGYVARDTVGNTAVVVHLISAVIIILAGAVQ